MAQNQALKLQESPQQAPLRVMIADDHALVRGGLALLLEMAEPGAEIVQANSFEQVCTNLRDNPEVDLILLDIMMPGMDGQQSIRQVCQRWPELPVVIVSVKEDSASIREAFEAGAMGYIPKTSSPDVTVGAVRLVLAGGLYVPPHVLDMGSAQITAPASMPAVDVQDVSGLTRRQLQVMELIVAGKSNQSTAEQLGLTLGTVKMHVSAIFKKLDVGSRTEAIAKYTSLH